MIRSIAFLCATVLLAACATASREMPSQQPTAQIADSVRRQAAKLQIRIRIPKGPHRARGSRYISAATKGMTIAFAGPSPFTQTIGLTPADPRCSGTVLVCTVTVSAAAGAYTATIDTYDEAPAGGSIPTNAQLLSTAKNVALALKRGTSNKLFVTLDGVPSTVAFSNFPQASVGTAFPAAPFSVAVKDASGETIVGTYATPIVLSDSDTTGATTLATSGEDSPPALTLLSSSDTVTIAYGGQPINAPTIGATGGVLPVAVSFPVGLPVYVADTGNNLVKMVPNGCEQASCITTLGGGWQNPYGIAVDKFGSVFVANENLAYVGEVSHGNACSDSSCVIKLGGGFDQVYAVAIDSSENLYVADAGHGLIKELPLTCINDASCVTTLPGAYGGPQGVAVDANGNVFVSNTFNGTIKEIPASCRGSDASCVLTLASGIAEARGIAVDAAGNVYVADPSVPTVYVFGAGCANPSCAGKIAGTFGKPAGVALDSNGILYLADAGTQKVSEITPGCVSACGISLGLGFDQPWGVAVAKL